MQRDFIKRDWRVIKPGDAVPQDIAPLIAMTGSRPVLAIACVGSSLIPETVRLVVGTLANHLDPLADMAGPPLLLHMEPTKGKEAFLTKPDLIPEGAYDPEFLERLRESGVTVEQKSQTEVYGIKGTAVMGTIDWRYSGSNRDGDGEWKDLPSEKQHRERV